MSDKIARPLGVLTQALLDVWSQAGHDVVVGLITGVLCLVFGGILGHNWVLAPLYGLVGFGAYYLLWFLYYVVRDSSGWSRRWRPSAEYEGGSNLRFTLERRGGRAWEVRGLACEVLGPDNNARLWTRADAVIAGIVDDDPSFSYPVDFTGATDPQPGIKKTYRSYWFEKTRRRRWREVAHKKHSITIPAVPGVL